MIKVLYWFWQKMDWATFLGNFFTISSGHPDAERSAACVFPDFRPSDQLNATEMKFIASDLCRWRRASCAETMLEKCLPTVDLKNL
jgi:hypothetical protein